MSRPMRSLSEEDTDTDDYPADNELSSNLPMHAEENDTDDRENQPPPTNHSYPTPLPPPTSPHTSSLSSSSSSPVKRPSHKRHRPSFSSSSPSPTSSTPCSPSHDPNLVLLDIGGVVFKTSRSTLLSLPNTYFTAHLTFPTPTPTHTTPPPPTQPLFIDRDSAHFRHILNFLRDRSLPEGLTLREMNELYREATYYAMDELREEIERVRGEMRQREEGEAERRRETERLLVLQQQHASANVASSEQRQLVWPNRSLSNPLQQSAGGMVAVGGGGGGMGVTAVHRAMSTAAADSFQLDADF